MVPTPWSCWHKTLTVPTSKVCTGGQEQIEAADAEFPLSLAGQLGILGIPEPGFASPRNCSSPFSPQPHVQLCLPLVAQWADRRMSFLALS